MADEQKVEVHSLQESSFPILLPTLHDVLPIKVSSSSPALIFDEQGATTVEPHTVEAAKAAIDRPFMQALLADKQSTSNATFIRTANGDAAFGHSGDSLVNLFHELEEAIVPERLAELLSAAWSRDALATLRIIWNARSIHLGKSSRFSFYRAIAWVADNHPDTFLLNLRWLVRPVIKRATSSVKQEAKKSEAQDGELVERMDIDEDSDFEIVDADAAESEATETPPTRESEEVSKFDIKYGNAHGYWKDLLNLLTLAAHGELHVNGKIRDVINKPKPGKAKERNWTAGQKKSRLANQHARIVRLLEENKFYQQFHATVARLFADQLRVDLARLQSGKKSDLKRISMAAKWAPSNKGSHDSQTFITSTIASYLYPTGFDESASAVERTLLFQQARIAYQSKVLAPLRKHLDILERYITEKAFDKIEYSHVPSLAMRQYLQLFLNKDFEHFEQYITAVAEGKAQVSGAILLPSVLVSTARKPPVIRHDSKSVAAMKEAAHTKLNNQLLDGQWKSLVQRIKNSGKLESAIAVCDVSGSMLSPGFSDGTCPMDSAVGLSLLLAKITEPPFGGAFIAFSARPHVLKVGGADDKRSLVEKCSAMISSDWGMTTDFVAVFEDLILPMALEHKIEQADMVKRVFVFSDMHFDKACWLANTWSTSYLRIKHKFEQAGYSMPELVFWNLAGGNKARSGGPKPVSASEEGTALVSGYSQAMMKMFLDGGSFDEVEGDDADVVLASSARTGETVKQPTEKESMTPVKMMHKAIGHEAYRMLQVVD